MLSDRQIFSARTLADFLKSPIFRRGLKITDLANREARVDHLKSFAEKGISKVGYQMRAIKAACEAVSGLWSGELWTGAGKSVVAAFIALKFLALGKKVIFICPSRFGLGSEDKDSGGIINKFLRTFVQEAPGEHFSGKYRLGRLNEATRMSDVHFFTPAVFVRLSKDKVFFRRLIEECGVLIVDEAHHFGKDPNGDEVIYGKIEKLSRSYFLNHRKKVVTLTATHGRMDGKPVVGKAQPDFRITVYEAVQMGYCPEIHGLPVYLEAKAPKARRSGSDFDLHLKGKQLARYIEEIVGRMIQIQRRKGNKTAQFAAFLRKVDEVNYLVEVWNNEAPRWGFKKIAAITKDTSHKERERIKAQLNAGELQGYATCNAGAESIDIPALSIVHLIVRTWSNIKLMQSIGRALRLHEGKRCILIVDYQIAEAKIIKGCLGLAAYGELAGVPKSGKVSEVGPLVVPKGSKNARFVGTPLAPPKGWIIKHPKGSHSHEENFPVLLDMARKGIKPRKSDKGYYKGIKLTSIAATLAYLRQKDRELQDTSA